MDKNTGETHLHGPLFHKLYDKQKGAGGKQNKAPYAFLYVNFHTFGTLN
jgi:hypothetical protein